MVDFNLINSLGNVDAEADSAVATALGEATVTQANARGARLRVVKTSAKR